MYGTKPKDPGTATTSNDQMLGTAAKVHLLMFLIYVCMEQTKGNKQKALDMATTTTLAILGMLLEVLQIAAMVSRGPR